MPSPNISKWDTQVDDNNDTDDDNGGDKNNDDNNDNKQKVNFCLKTSPSHHQTSQLPSANTSKWDTQSQKFKMFLSLKYSRKKWST